MKRGIALVAALLVNARAEAAPLDSVPESGKLSFALMRDGSRIGTHSYAFRHEDDALVVEARIDVTVRFAFVTVYRYSGTCKEIWRDGRLDSYEADTDDDGTAVKVRGRATEAGFAVEGTAGPVTLPADAMALTLWSRGAIEGAPLFDMDDGVPLTVKIEPLGGTPVARFHVTGDVDYEMSFAGPILKGVRITARDGSIVEYVPE